MTGTPAATAYDRVAYPSGVFATTHPDHLATIARIHGLNPPSPHTARVLEIGGGDGMNLIAMAAAYPDAEFLSFDLAQAPVARGQAIIAASGLTNVRVEMLDILDAARDLEGPFDYISAHGVYAWVPGPVRDALLALIGRVLSPDGVAFVSYNALPGGHFRRVVREMTLHHVKDIADPDARIAAAAAFLKAYSQPQPDDRPLLAAMRDVARPIAAKVGQVLFHDELGEVFEPQAFCDVAEAAARHGLRFLNEAEPGRIDQGMPDADIDEAALIHAVQADDYALACFFHQTLFVRSERAPARRPALGAIADLYASARCTRTGAADFTSHEGTFGISDLPLADAVAKIGETWPQRIRVGDLIDDELRLEAIYRLFLGKAILLHTTPLPGVTTPGDRPRVSALARALLALGEEKLFTLDHRSVILEEPAPRAFLTLLDGSRDWATIEADWARSGHADDTDATTALARFASVPLLVG
jgi:SAM-dependent methyltransferase